MVNVGVTAAIKDAEVLSTALLLLSLRASLQRQMTPSLSTIEKESVGHHFKHLMNGVSHMLALMLLVVF